MTVFSILTGGDDRSCAVAVTALRFPLGEGRWDQRDSLVCAVHVPASKLCVLCV